MLRQAAGEPLELDGISPPRGAAIQVRIYAEDPARQFRPSSGLVTRARFPAAARVETWIADGTDVTPLYDPLLAKIIASGEDRPQALHRLRAALADTTITGIETNLEYLRRLIEDPVFAGGGMTTRTLDTFSFAPRRVEVLAGGTQTTFRTTREGPDIGTSAFRPRGRWTMSPFVWSIARWATSRRRPPWK
jgi:urea carboxylase